MKLLGWVPLSVFLNSKKHGLLNSGYFHGQGSDEIQLTRRQLVKMKQNRRERND